MTRRRTHQEHELFIRYKPFLRAKAQANFLDQEWRLSFEQFCELWTIDKWHCRGRGTHDLVMVRKDQEGPWSMDNCEIVTRITQIQRTARIRGGKFYKEKRNGIHSKIDS